MSSLKIKIHGRHRLERVPEIGKVSITARSISLSKMTAVTEVEKISQKLHEMIAPLAIRTEDGAPAPDAAVLGWTVSPMYCDASEWFPDPRARSTQASAQTSAQTSPQASANATQANAQASTQTSPQASTQTSPQARTQTNPQARTQAILRAKTQSIIERIVEASNQESAQGHNQARIQALVGISFQSSVQSIIDMIVEAGNRESAQAHNQARIQALHRDQSPLCRNYSATIKLGVTFGNFAKLREFADQIAEIPEASIDEICWGLSEASYLLADAEVREMALRNALRLADDYAKSLGRDVVPVEIRPRRVKFDIPKQIMQAQVGDPSIAPRPVQIVPRNILFTNTVKVIFGPV
ncbi:Protein of unknown function DUF541 [Penicillium brevicompactum]|uniref:DUF541 domain-containing protein n=1 Tax=Penicillium brevicompactum TaxID=5074 RepID=A0A9W9RCG9_PENBR|nr:Protein of unknown function DUF541 [Penicillium brevicompactum]